MKFSSVFLLVAAVSVVEADNLNQITQLRRNLDAASDAKCKTDATAAAKCKTDKTETTAPCKASIAADKKCGDTAVAELQKKNADAKKKSDAAAAAAKKSAESGPGATIGWIVGVVVLLGLGGGAFAIHKGKCAMPSSSADSKVS